MKCWRRQTIISFKKELVHYRGRRRRLSAADAGEGASCCEGCSPLSLFGATAAAA